MLRGNTGSGRVLPSLHMAILKPQHIHTRAQNHPDKQKSQKSRCRSRI